MKQRVLIVVVSVLYFLFKAPATLAQRVLYSPYIDSRYISHFEVAGKTGDFYWVRKERRKRQSRKETLTPANTEQTFEIYDQRMLLHNTLTGAAPGDSTIKDYFVSWNNYADELQIVHSINQLTTIWVKRNDAGGALVSAVKKVGSFDFYEQSNSFVLVQSENKTKALLLAFESVPESPPKMHAILFDENWNRLSENVYEHPFISQPLIQDDFFCYPIDHYSNGPLKLADNGQWLMESPSRTNRNFLLFHFLSFDKSFSYHEIKLPSSASTEDVNLSIDNGKQEVYAAVLSRFKYNNLKNVQVTHYSMINQAFDFDSSYRFNTLLTGKAAPGSLYNESLVAVPGNGFLLLKEYGRAFSESVSDLYNTLWDPEIYLTNQVVSNNTEMIINKDGYTRNSSLAAGRNIFERGDLNVFYFPAFKQDSCWSGIINKNQVTELNSPYLSYLVIPSKDKLIFLYNSFIDNDGQYGSTTVLDHSGRQIEEGGTIFWRYNNTLNFQNARQISSNEVSVPYESNQRQGFAIIRFN